MCSFFFSSRRRHTRWPRDWSSDVCSSDLEQREAGTHKKHKSQLHRIVAAVTLALIAELGSWWSGASALWFVLAFAAILLSGLQVYKKGWIALKNRNLNINALMSIAVTGAVLIGEWPEAAMVMSLFALAEWIEARSLIRARNAVEQLLSIAPDHVSGWGAHTDRCGNKETRMGARGRLVGGAPGERIGLDGEIGRASCRERVGRGGGAGGRGTERARGVRV